MASRPRLRWIGSKRDYSREDHDRASFVLAAALAEAGHPLLHPSVWDPSLHGYRLVPPYPPADLLEKARIIAMDAVGIQWEWKEVP